MWLPPTSTPAAIRTISTSQNWNTHQRDEQTRSVARGVTRAGPPSGHSIQDVPHNLEKRVLAFSAQDRAESGEAGLATGENIALSRVSEPCGDTHPHVPLGGYPGRPAPTQTKTM